MDEQFIRELRQKYIQNPPEGMTAALVKNMTDGDLLDMHYFLTEDDDLGDGLPKIYNHLKTHCQRKANGNLTVGSQNPNLSFIISEQILSNSIYRNRYNVPPLSSASIPFL